MNSYENCPQNAFIRSEKRGRVCKCTPHVNLLYGIGDALLAFSWNKDQRAFRRVMGLGTFLSDLIGTSTSGKYQESSKKLYVHSVIRTFPNLFSTIPQLFWVNSTKFKFHWLLDSICFSWFKKKSLMHIFVMRKQKKNQDALLKRRVLR